MQTASRSISHWKDHSCQNYYERFKGNLKRNKKGQFHKTNEILHEWFKNGSSNGWLEKWKISYGIREKRGEACEVSGKTVNEKTLGVNKRL